MPGALEHVDGRLTIRHLRLVTAIAEEGNLVGAAKRLHMTQPAVTKALKEAESLLDVQLFERTNRGVLPTVYGTALAAHARLVITQLKHAGEEIRDLRDGSGGRVAIGTMHSASAELLPKAIAMLRKNRPRLSVTITDGSNEQLMEALRIGALDLVVGRLPEFDGRDGLAQELLFTDGACVVVRPGHPLAGRPTLALSELVHCDWVLPSQTTTLRYQFDKAFRDQGLTPPQAAAESVSHLTTRGLVVHSDYLSVLPWQVAQPDAAIGRFAILPVALPPTMGEMGIVTRASTRLSPAAEQLLRTLRTVAAGMQPYVPLP